MPERKNSAYRMNKKRKCILLCPLLIVFWLIPLFKTYQSIDAEYLKSAAACLLFLTAALICRLLPNCHAALISTCFLGVGLCVFFPTGVYDVAPTLLLCCWLRCYLESGYGRNVKVYYEVFTDLIYLYLVAAVVRLIRSGYSFLEIQSTDMQSIPDLCLMVLVLMYFTAFFFRKDKNVARQRTPQKKAKQRTPRRAGGNVVGLIPVVVSRRTFFGFCSLLLLASVLQYTNGNLIIETTLFLRSGFRLLFFPWMVLLYIVLDWNSPYLFPWDREYQR